MPVTRPVLSLSLITEPLRVANRELGRSGFDGVVVSDGGGTCSSSSALPLRTLDQDDCKPDAALLLASYQPERSYTPRTLSWLRRLDRQNCLLGCVDTEALVFARAGLLDARPAAAHPEAIAGFHRQFPDSLFIDRMFDFSPPRCSSAGGVATLDMTLSLIAHFATDQLARRVAQILIYERHLATWQPQPMPGSIRHVLRDAVAVMQSNLVHPLPVSSVAGTLGVPVWKLNRLFTRYLYASPTSYYVGMRLERARDMLRNTTLRVGDVATECGYDNAEVFSRAYRKKFSKQPSQDRSL